MSTLFKFGRIMVFIATFGLSELGVKMGRALERHEIIEADKKAKEEAAAKLLQAQLAKIGGLQFPNGTAQTATTTVATEGEAAKVDFPNSNK